MKILTFTLSFVLNLACTGFGKQAADDNSDTASGRLGKATETPDGVPGYEITYHRFGAVPDDLLSSIIQPKGSNGSFDTNAFGQVGLRIPISQAAAEMYVLSVSPKENEVAVGRDEDADTLRRFVFGAELFSVDASAGEVFIPMLDDRMKRSAFVVAKRVPDQAGYRPFFGTLALGTSSTCAIVDDGRVKCWGLNNAGSLGFPGVFNAVGAYPGDMESLPYIELGTGAVAAQLSAGLSLHCALLQDGSVKCWGNRNGLLGIGDSTRRGEDLEFMGDALPSVDLGSGRYARQITVGHSFTCALLDNGTVKCWGQLPGMVESQIIGNEPGEMGDALEAISLGANRSIKQVAASGGHVCLLSDLGEVWCWGRNSNGELGAYHSQETVPTLPFNTLASRMKAVDLGSNARAIRISVGHTNTCALLEDRRLKCWGSNSQGQLGFGDSLHGVEAPNQYGRGVTEMGDHLPSIDLGVGVFALATVQSHSSICAQLGDSRIKCWGRNDVGQLGLGVTDAIGNDDLEMGDDLAAVNLGEGRTAKEIAAAVASFHFCARLDNGDVKCWGLNNSGELGQGDANHRGDEPGEMGDALPAITL